MTVEERKRLRNCLTDQGFERTQYTQDIGEGIYNETWRKDTNVVVIYWGPRS